MRTRLSCYKFLPRVRIVLRNARCDIGNCIRARVCNCMDGGEIHTRNEYLISTVAVCVEVHTEHTLFIHTHIYIFVSETCSRTCILVNVTVHRYTLIECNCVCAARVCVCACLQCAHIVYRFLLSMVKASAHEISIYEFYAQHETFTYTNIMCITYIYILLYTPNFHPSRLLLRGGVDWCFSTGDDTHDKRTNEIKKKSTERENISEFM